MHSLYPSLGVQKWSKITTKWCQFQNKKPTKTPSASELADLAQKHIVVLIERVTQMHALYPSLGSKVKQGLLSPKSCKPSQRSNNRTQQHKKPHRTQKHKQKKTSKKPQRGLDMTAPIDCSINCLRIEDLAHESKKKRKTTEQDLAKMSSKTHHPAAPKPRIPPARIPEIALRSPSA